MRPIDKVNLTVKKKTKTIFHIVLSLMFGVIATICGNSTLLVKTLTILPDGLRQRATSILPKLLPYLAG